MDKKGCKTLNHIVGLMLWGLLLSFCACTGPGKSASVDLPNPDVLNSKEGSTAAEPDGKTGTMVDRPGFAQLAWESCGELVYADQFRLEKSGEYQLLTIVDSGRFLLVSGEIFQKGLPEGIPEDVIVLQVPIERGYLASTSVFDLIGQLGAMDRIRFSSVRQDGLTIPKAIEALESGSMLYAGKYSAPDYELLLMEGCELAVENTMIYHNPEAKEKLEQLGIPVLVERSSYESHPLGRMEWIKVYGALLGKEKEARDFFDQRMEALEPILEKEKSGCRVAFFYVNTNGVVNVRKPGDYIPKMIELAGGEYVLQSAEAEENALSTMNMQMEDFYLAARDADILIYNGTTTGALESLDQLLEKNALFADFKAVKEQRVYCTGKNFFQETTAIGDLMEDLDRIIRGQDSGEFHQLSKLTWE